MNIDVERHNKSMAKAILWVDNLCLCSLWSVWRSVRKFHSYTICYKKINPIVKHLLRPIEKKGCLRSLKYSLGNMKTEEGASLRYKINTDIIDMVEKIVSQMYKRNQLFTYLTRFPEDKTLLYLKQRLSEHINESILVLNVVDYYCKNNRDIANSINIIVSKAGYILNSCFTENKRKTFVIIGYWSIDNLRFQRSTFRILLEILGQILRSLFYFMQFKKHISADTSLPQRIGIPCTQKIDLNKRSNLFWIPYSSVEVKRILVYFDDSKKPVTEETAKLLEEYGIDWLVLRRKASELGKKNLWKLPPLNSLPFFAYLKDVWKMIISLVFQSGYLKLWQWHMLIELLIQTYYYETFYRDANITILYNMNESEWAPTVNAIAVGLANGISVSTHWSNHAGSSLVIAKAHDVFFAWGHIYIKRLQKSMSCFYHVIQCGYIYDCYFNNAKIKANSLRKKLKNNSVFFIIGFMDNIFGKDLSFSKEEMLRLYQALLNLTITDRRIGLILKPKRSKDTIGQMEEIQSLLKEAFATGRCLIVDKTNLECFNFEAGLACDLVIGFGASTIAIENALAGIRSVNYDPTGNRDTPEYKEGYNKILFDDIDLLIQSIKENIDVVGKDSGFGDFNSVLDKIDPFRDGKAAERIGFYMNELLAALDLNFHRDMAIERASQKYQERYGYDKVDKFERKIGKFIA